LGFRPTPLNMRLEKGGAGMLITSWRVPANGRGIDYLELLHPLRHLVGAAVRRKPVLVGQVQVHVDLSEDSLIPPRVRIRERGATWKVHDAQMLKLAALHHGG